MPPDLHVLLVEDNPGDARLIHEMLRVAGPEKIHLDPVTTLEVARERVQTRHYDAVLLDLFLPDSRGSETLLQMAAAAPECALVVLTGLEDDQLGLEAVQMGAQDYLPKGGVDSRLLLRSLRYAVERQRAESSLRRSQEAYRSLIDDVFDTSMVAVLILDRALNVVWCNEATEVYFGIARERLLGRDKRLLIDEELKCVFADPQSYSARLLEAYETGAYTDRFECHVLAAPGRDERWLEHWSQPIRAGIYAGGRIEQYTDITDRKVLEFAERAQREFAEALHDISTVLSSSLDLNDVLERILASLSRVVPHDAASITIEGDEQLHTARFPNAEVISATAPSVTPWHYAPFMRQMLRTRAPMIIPDLQRDGHARTALGELCSYIGAPIQLQEQIIGFINLVSVQPDFFTPRHAERLSAFSKLAAIAIQNARLYDSSRRLATLEERQRLARDLHDSVSQTLFTCRTISETALRRWEKDPARAYELMRDVNELTAIALAEMRILLLELRPAALTQLGIKQLFEQYLQPIQERRAFDLVMALEEIPALPPEVQIALYRITQEALNNIDKHAQASRVEIRVQDQAGNVILDIQDNGLGFDLDAIALTSLGLHIMRERAEAIGASLEVASRLEQGTQIRVNWKRSETR
ncbi:MAG: response regulator [Anaerolineae bacterium]|nr:response regulator [Anaerolineae bacterium]